MKVIFMDILSAVAIRLPCRQCGEPYMVPLRDILLSHQIMHEGCPVAPETECPPLFQARLASNWAIKTFEEAWRRLERRAKADGGELVMHCPTSASTPASETETNSRATADSSSKSKPRRGAA
jgi:hypothetical protein